jgi:hypothetical protein
MSLTRAAAGGLLCREWTQGERNWTYLSRFITTVRRLAISQMSLGSISRALFAIEAVILAAIEALSLFTHTHGSSAVGLGYLTIGSSDRGVVIIG